jgi:hypothetical protein
MQDHEVSFDISVAAAAIYIPGSTLSEKMLMLMKLHRADGML